MSVDYSQTLSGFEPLPEGFASRLWPEAHPYLLHAATERARGIVIGLHGYRATPHEIRQVMEACQATGFDAVSILFAGHGMTEYETQRRAIRQMYPRALQQAVVHEIVRCRSLGYERVFLFGHSMGGCIAVRAAAIAGVDALAVTAPALQLPPIASLMDYLPPGLDPTWNRRSSAPDDTLRYPFETAVGVCKLLRMGEHARATLPKVKAPTLVVQARQDVTIPAVVGDLIERDAGGEVTRRWYEESAHSMHQGPEAQQIAAAIAEFFDAHA